MSEKIDLLPCPFCGCEDAGLHENVSMVDDNVSWSVDCNNCGASVIENTAEQAAEAWNRRAIVHESEKDARTGEWISHKERHNSARYIYYKCSECGYEDGYPPNYCPNCGAKMEVAE